MKGPSLTAADFITLPDGRRLSFDDHGDPAGVPVIFFHGVPGSRSYWSLAGPGDPAADRGVRLISIDRPGLGRSTPMPDRTVTSFADDVLVLADALEIGRFSTLGFSGGAAYALATAARAPGRVGSIGLVAPLGDLGVPRLIASLEPSMRRALTIAARSQAVVRSRFVEGYDARRLMKRGAEKIWSYLPAADRRVLSRDGVRASAIGTMEEAALHGLEGVRLDAELLLAPWDFDLSEVAAPVDLFCGGADPWSTDEIAHWFKRGLRQVRLHRDPSGGHFTTLVTRADVVLGTVTNRAVDMEAQVAAASHATAV